MNVKECLVNSGQLFWRNKIRSFLTVLGIIIGIAGVIVIVSLGNGAQELIVNQIQSIGSNLIAVFPGNSDDGGPPASVLGIVVKTLKYNDILSLKNNPQARYVEEVSAYVRGNETVYWQGKKVEAVLLGSSYTVLKVEDTDLQAGSFFTKAHEQSLAKVVVLGADIAHDLFGKQNPIGQMIKLGKHYFRVIGVMRPRGSVAFSNQDQQVYIPITTAQKLILGIDYINFARIKVKDETKIEQTKNDVNNIIRQRHKIKSSELSDFSIKTQEEATKTMLNITQAIKFFLVIISGLSLIVGGIGIMNVMLASVQERIREIGLRKAVGAKNSHILLQFLIETIFLTFISGVMGIIIGISLSYLINLIINRLGFEWNFSISWLAIVISTFVSVLIGLVFGLIPAKKASKLDPIEALQYE